MLNIYVVPVTPFAQNARLLVLHDKRAVLVDPGGEAGRLLSVIEEKKLTVEAIWLTHSHLDHCGAAAEIIRKLAVPMYASAAGRRLRQEVEEQARYFNMPPGIMENCPEPDVYLKGGETLDFGEYPFKVLATPGHVPDHLCYYSEKTQILLSGDCLFSGAVGRTDLPGGNPREMTESLRRLAELPGETKVFAGHGPDTVIEKELKTNPFLRIAK